MARKRHSNSHRGGPCVEMERVLRSKVAAISPFVDKLMLLIKNRRCAPGNETDIESALREAPENAVIHGNHVDPRKHVYVRCRCKEEEVSIIVKDEGEGFDSNALPDPTSPGAIELNRGRGIYLMKGRKAISLEPFGYERNGGSSAGEELIAEPACLRSSL